MMRDICLRIDTYCGYVLRMFAADVCCECLLRARNLLMPDYAEKNDLAGRALKAAYLRCSVRRASVVAVEVETRV